MGLWSWNKKQLAPGGIVPMEHLTAPASSKDQDIEGSYARLSDLMADGQSKNFDWMHYQAVTQGSFNSMFAGEFSTIASTRVLKGMYIQEFWVNACVNAITRQFLSAGFQLGHSKTRDGQQKLVKKHPLLDYLKFAGSDVENMAFFTANSIADLVLTGNAYWWTSKDLKIKRRIPSERIEPVVENNKIVKYRLYDKGDMGFTSSDGTMVFQPEEITHLKLPNPFTPHVGLSLLIATTLPVLIDKYGMEYVVGFFLRGGQTAGVIETNTTNMDQLLKLARTIMQAFGGRKNMHADKILPNGATWKGQGNTFGQLGLIDLMKQNIGMFRAATGCTNTVLGIVENVNKAVAREEMKLFYRSTILPLQSLFCMGITSSSLWKRFGLDADWELTFDNTGVPELDDFDDRIEQDKGLGATWTVNERRERLGKDPIDGYDLLEIELKPTPAPAPAAPNGNEPPPEKAIKSLSAWKEAEAKIQDPDKAVRDLFRKEFEAWRSIVLDNLTSRASATAKLAARAASFATDFAQLATPAAMAAYDNQRKHLKLGGKAAGGLVIKESDEQRKAKFDLLRERAADVMEGRVMRGARESFVGYSQTQMERVYDIIENGLSQGLATDDVASLVRQEFDGFIGDTGTGEAYSGQAETIVRTEYSCAVSRGQEQFGDDLASVANKMAKYWVSMGDKHVRQSHELCERQSPIEGDSADVVDATFLNGLRFPRDPAASDKPEEIINCRCTVRYQATEWA